MFKSECKAERYLNYGISRRERSIVAQLRCGILPIRIEVGRYKGEKESERICTLCKRKEIENELHFLLHCDNYISERTGLFSKMLEIDCNFTQLNDADKIFTMMHSMSKTTCKYINECFEKRKNVLYKS